MPSDNFFKIKSLVWTFISHIDRCFAVNAPWPILFIQNENVIEAILSKIVPLELKEKQILRIQSLMDT